LVNLIWLFVWVMSLVNLIWLFVWVMSLNVEFGEFDLALRSDNEFKC
jgi:hypothetical protein